MLGTDLLVHAGALAQRYLEPTPFLLGPEDAFRRIPLGYAGFALLALLLVWTQRASGSRGALGGAWFGLRLGLLVWGGLVLGLWSITSADPGLLLGWLLGQTAGLAVAGAFAGRALSAARVRGHVLRALAYALACLVVIVALQSAGLVPALRATPG
jgi:hypothetical protein